MQSIKIPLITLVLQGLIFGHRRQFRQRHPFSIGDSTSTRLSRSTVILLTFDPAGSAAVDRQMYIDRRSFHSLLVYIVILTLSEFRLMLAKLQK